MGGAVCVCVCVCVHSPAHRSINSDTTQDAECTLTNCKLAKLWSNACPGLALNYQFILVSKYFVVFSKMQVNLVYELCVKLGQCGKEWIWKIDRILKLTSFHFNFFTYLFYFHFVHKCNNK